MAVAAVTGAVADRSVGRITLVRQINKVRPTRASPCVTRAQKPETQLKPAQPIPTQTNALVQRIVAAATGVLRLRQLGASDDAPVSQAGRLSPGDIDGILQLIEQDFKEKKYFITGDISDIIYADDCYFADPTVQFSGLAKWKANLKLLVPFLIEPSINLTHLAGQQQQQSQPQVLQAQWTLQTTLKLPWRPFVDVIGSTDYVLNAEANQIVRHIESWNITPVQAIKQIFTPAPRK